MNRDAPPPTALPLTLLLLPLTPSASEHLTTTHFKWHLRQHPHCCPPLGGSAHISPLPPLLLFPCLLSCASHSHQYRCCLLLIPAQASSSNPQPRGPVSCSLYPLPILFAHRFVTIVTTALLCVGDLEQWEGPM